MNETRTNSGQGFSTWLVLLRWKFRGENKTGLIIHARDRREAEERVHAILPPTFFRAEDFKIVIAPARSILPSTSGAENSSASNPLPDSSLADFFASNLKPTQS